jgi:hypothetical protein
MAANALTPNVAAVTNEKLLREFIKFFPLQKL